jgi:hypothetical protein
MRRFATPALLIGGAIRRPGRHVNWQVFSQ